MSPVKLGSLLTTPDTPAPGPLHSKQVPSPAAPACSLSILSCSLLKPPRKTFPDAMVQGQGLWSAHFNTGITYCKFFLLFVKDYLLFQRGPEVRSAVEPCALPWLEPVPPWDAQRLTTQGDCDSCAQARRTSSGPESSRCPAEEAVVPIPRETTALRGWVGPSQAGSSSPGPGPAWVWGWRMSSALHQSSVIGPFKIFFS